MKTKTETRIKRALLSLHKAVMQYYEEHPEGRRNMQQEIDCYGSASIGVRDFGSGVEGIATITLCTEKGYCDIDATIHHKELKTWKQN